MVIDWQDYLKCSVESGCNLNSILHKIESAVGDCFGSHYREEVMKRIGELNHE
jgi:hypothetical protein